MPSTILREIRINPIIPAESVLIATERGGRPSRARAPLELDRRTLVADCPFCRGNEHLTPEAILQLPADGPWQVRTVRNLYPVFGDDRSLPSFNLGIHRVIDGYGQHEVIIDHPDHGIQLCEMSSAHLALLLRLYRDRMATLYRANANHRYVLIFKNFGPASGGSIPHTHSQVIAMPVIPANVEMELASSRKHLKTHDSCIFCTLIDEKLTFEATLYDRRTGEMRRTVEAGAYIIDRESTCLAIKPFASRYPWEVHILPNRHSHDFRTISDEEILDMAMVLQRVMRRLAAVLGVVQYNYFLHSAPGRAGSTCAASFHWHLEICPRTSVPNGFELGSGLAINTISPELAAEQLRAVDLS